MAFDIKPKQKFGLVCGLIRFMVPVSDCHLVMKLLQ